MKEPLPLLLLVVFTCSVAANPIAVRVEPPHIIPILQGEMVYARLGPDAAYVEGVFQFPGGFDRVDQILFPVFAPRKSSGSAIVDRVAMSVSWLGQTVTDVIEVDAPFKVDSVPADAEVHWLCAYIPESPNAAAKGDNNRPPVLRITYRQPYVNGRFLYLPLLPGKLTRSDGGRPWAYQLSVRSLTGRILAEPVGADFERVSDMVVVFLRDRQIVEIPAGKAGKH